MENLTEIKQQPLYCQTLGHFELYLDGQAVHFAYDKMRALFVYLLFEQANAHRREHLAQLLWPEHSEKEARANLRNALSRLNRSLSSTDCPWLICDKKRLQFNTELPLETDAFHLLNVPALITNAQLASQAKSALELYQGSFLAELQLQGCEAFNGWVQHMENKLRSHALQLATSASTFYQQEKNREAALFFARQRVNLQPDDEAGHRELMSLLVHEDGVDSVKQHYEWLCRFLRERYDLEPEESTQALVRQLCETFPVQETTENHVCFITALYTCYKVADSSDLEHQALLLEALCEELVQTAEQNGGYCLQPHAGSLLVYYGRSTSSEHDCHHAAHTALLFLKLANQYETLLSLGIHTAPTLVTTEHIDRSNRVTGQAMELAVKAKAGEILISKATASLLEKDYVVELSKVRIID